MTGESYIIKYESMSQFYNYMTVKIDEWYTALSEWNRAYNEVINMECFQGKAADTAKTYFQEVHGPLLYALTSALQAFQTSFLLYKDGFYEMDEYIYSNIPKENLMLLKEVLKTESVQLDTISNSIQTSLNSISDIFPLSNPTKYVLQSTIEGVKNEITALDAQIDSYEESQYTTLKGDLQALLDSLQSTIDNYVLNGTQVVSYVPGSYCDNLSLWELYDKVEVSNTYLANNQDKITSAYEKHLEVYEQMVADYEAKVAEQRKEEGVAKILEGVVAVAIGIGAIVCTAGTATPVVVSIVGGVTGTCSTAYGLSNVAEGSYDIYYGSIGDITTEAFSPIRDTYFCGNQTLYDAWGSLNMTCASIFLQTGKFPSSLSGMATAVLKETGEDMACDFASGVLTEYGVEKWDMGVAESTVLNIGFNMGLGLMAGTVRNKFDNLLCSTNPLVSPDVAKVGLIEEGGFAGNEHINVGDINVHKFSNWDEMKDAYNGGITKFVQENKPKYSPDIKKWFSNGGLIEIQNIDGKQIWIYTSAVGHTVPYVDGYIEFPDKYLNPTIKFVDIGGFSGDRSKDINKMMAILEEDYGITEIPDGYVVHHDTINGILQLVDENIHQEFTHIGGYSLYQ